MKKIHKIVVVIFIVAVFSALTVSVLAKDKTPKMSRPAAAPTASAVVNTAQPKDNHTVIKEALDASASLALLGLRSDNIKNIEKNNSSPDGYTVTFSDGSTADFDETLRLKGFSALNRSEPVSVDSEKLILALKRDYHIDASYRLSIGNTAMGNTEYYFEKTDENGILNPYDALRIIFDEKTEMPILFRRFYGFAEQSAVITEDEALSLAVKAHPQYGKQKDYPIEKCSLVYYQDEEENVRLSYQVVFAEAHGLTVYVDARTGEAFAFDMLK